MDTTKVGFYKSAHMGLTFNMETLQELQRNFKSFKNSVMLIYDISKANFGLNPIHAFRLSAKAIDSLDKLSPAGAADTMNLV